MNAKSAKLLVPDRFQDRRMRARLLVAATLLIAKIIAMTPIEVTP